MSSTRSKNNAKETIAKVQVILQRRMQFTFHPRVGLLFPALAVTLVLYGKFSAMLQLLGKIFITWHVYNTPLLLILQIHLSQKIIPNPFKKI